VSHLPLSTKLYEHRSSYFNLDLIISQAIILGLGVLMCRQLLHFVLYPTLYPSIRLSLIGGLVLFLPMLLLYLLLDIFQLSILPALMPI
jgi:hypothetical protein